MDTSFRNYCLKNRISLHPLYRVWENLKQKCYNKNNKTYPSFGGKGIYLCNEWLNSSDFCKWGDQMGMTKEQTVILNPGEMMYSPNTCSIISKKKLKRGFIK